MKLKVILIHLCVLIINFTHAQPTTVYTCKGGAVAALFRSEFSPEGIALRNDYTIATYATTLGITFLDNSSQQYNCHAYAWHLREGNTNKVWINNATSQGGNCFPETHNIDKYWTDGCFIQVCNEVDADKLHYFCGDHSAVKSTTHPGFYESKWGELAVVRHTKTGVPYAQPATSVNYYASTKVSGSTANLCSGTRTFLVKNITGATYVWTYSSTLAVVGSINTNQITIQRNGIASGAAWVSVQISTPCSATPANSRQDFTIAAPPVELSDITVRYTRNQGSLQTIDFGTLNNKTVYTQTGSFSVTASTFLTGTNTLNWVVMGPPPGSGYGWSNFTKSDGSCSFTLSGTNAPTIPLQVTLTNTQNGCTTSATNNKIVVFVGSIPGAAMVAFDVSPNPASTTIDITASNNINELSATTKNNVTSSIKEIKLIDKMGNIKLTKRYADDLTKSDRINIAHLPNDIYTLMIFNGTDWEAHKIVKQ